MKNKLILGTWQFGGSFGYWETQEREDSKAVIKAALKSGINTFDTAYSYLNTETLLSSILPQTAKIYTKVQPIPSFEKKFKTSLMRLKRDNIDTLFIHWPTDDEPLLEATIETLFKLKEEGLVSNIGYSNFPISLLKSLPLPDKIERAVSLLWTKELFETKAWCKNYNIILTGYSPLAMGLLSGKYKLKDDLKDKRENLYCLQHPIQYKALLDSINSIAEKYNVTMSKIALSWALNQCDEVVFGARNLSSLYDNISPICLTDEDIVYLNESSKPINNFATSDNMLSHNWRLHG